MKVIKVVYDTNTNFILDIVEPYNDSCIVEIFDMDHYKEVKKGRPILTRHGTKNLPLIVFEDENLDEVAAIWSETSPDWGKEIEKMLNKLT